MPHPRCSPTIFPICALCVCRRRLTSMPRQARFTSSLPASRHTKPRRALRHLGSRKKTRDIASPYRLKMDTRPDYPIGAHAPGCDLTQLLRREPDVALAAAEQAQQLGLEPDSEELRDALAFVDAQLFDVVMACLSSHQKDRPEPAAVEAALSAFCDHYAQNVGRSLRGEPLTPCPMDASGRAVRRALMVGATVVCGVVWAVVVVSAALLASGARVTATLGSLVWSGTLPGIIAALALTLPGIAGVTAGALARNRRSGFLQGVLALSACEVPVLVVAACSVFSQRAVMGGLVAALVATYTLTWFLLAMGFAFELPVSAPRRTKARWRLRLPVEPQLPVLLADLSKYRPILFLRPRRPRSWHLKLSSPHAGPCLTSLSARRI